MSDQRTLRAIVRSEPQAVYRADYPCIVYVTVCHLAWDGETENTPVLVSNLASPGQDWKGHEATGTPVPYETLYPVDMDPGDVLWALTAVQAEIGLTVVRK